MATNDTIALARAIAFACRDGRKAREAGLAEQANPYAGKASRVALTETASCEHARRVKLFDAWRAGWLMSERRGALADRTKVAPSKA